MYIKKTLTVSFNAALANFFLSIISICLIVNRALAPIQDF